MRTRQRNRRRSRAAAGDSPGCRPASGGSLAIGVLISFVETGDQKPEDAIVVLKDPQIDGDSLTYTVDLLEGSLPPKGELVSVFIDPFGRPLSPVSLAGMNRRARRRGR